MEWSPSPGVLGYLLFSSYQMGDLRFDFVIKITFDYQRERGTGVEHMAICPAFAETEVTLNTDGTMECLRRNC